MLFLISAPLLGRAKCLIMVNPYNQDLDQNPANYQPLTPLSFLERASDVFPDHTAIIHGNIKRTYREFYTRSKQLASSLKRA
jgi:fatty-acyl-CoA synthase